MFTADENKMPGLVTAQSNASGGVGIIISRGETRQIIATLMSNGQLLLPALNSGEAAELGLYIDELGCIEVVREEADLAECG